MTDHSRMPAPTHGTGSAAAVHPHTPHPPGGGGTLIDLKRRLEARERRLADALRRLDDTLGRDVADVADAARTILELSANPAQIARARGILALIDGRGPRG